MFKSEIVKGETVFSCNICDEGFYFIDELNKHIVDTHDDIMNHILTIGFDEGECDSE